MAAEVAGPAGAVGAAGVGGLASSTASCNSPDGRTCQVSRGTWSGAPDSLRARREGDCYLFFSPRLSFPSEEERQAPHIAKGLGLREKERCLLGQGRNRNTTGKKVFLLCCKLCAESCVFSSKEGPLSH